MNFKNLLAQAKNNDNTAVLSILEMYKPLLIKESIIDGEFNEDLHSELCIVLLRCIAKIRI